MSPGWILWKTSGHVDYYRENMFAPMKVEGSEYQLKPMNCPYHIMIYKSHLRSYRDLPIRYGELGRSIVMNGQEYFMDYCACADSRRTTPICFVGPIKSKPKSAACWTLRFSFCARSDSMNLRCFSQPGPKESVGGRRALDAGHKRTGSGAQKPQHCVPP